MMNRVKRKLLAWAMVASLGAVATVKGYKEYRAYEELMMNLDQIGAYCQAHVCKAPFDI